MEADSFSAVFMRGGTSKALMVHGRDVPADREEWPAFFCAAMGSPDPLGRQLNGMGGGVSSVSKVCVVNRSDRPDADVDYTFVQVLIREARIDMSGNCGNMLSAIGPFAVDEGLIRHSDGPATVRIFNTNTRKVIHATFDVENGQTIYKGDLAIPGVGGKGAPIRLDFVNPGGATTGRLLPTGRVRDTLQVEDLGMLEVSMVDAANACVFVRAPDLGLRGTELPADLNTAPDILRRLARIREAASVEMGIAHSTEEAKSITHVPFVCFVSGAQDAMSTDGIGITRADVDLTARVISNGQPHLALPLTATLCLAVAAGLKGSVVADLVGERARPELRVGMPSGVLTADAAVENNGDAWKASRGSFFRTARKLFKGKVFLEGALRDAI